MFSGAGLSVTRTPPSSPCSKKCMQYPPPLPCPPAQPSLIPLSVSPECKIPASPVPLPVEANDLHLSILPVSLTVQDAAVPSSNSSALLPPPPPPPPLPPQLRMSPCHGPPPPPPPLPGIFTTPLSGLATLRKPSASRKKAITPGILWHFLACYAYMSTKICN